MLRTLQHGNIVMAMPPPMYAMAHQAEVRTTAPAVHAAMQLQQIGHGYDRRGACREWRLVEGARCHSMLTVLLLDRCVSQAGGSSGIPTFVLIG